MERHVEEKAFRAYVTDALQVITENSAVPASAYSKGDAGKTIKIRWYDAINRKEPEVKEERTAEEIISSIKSKLGGDS